MRGGPTVRSNVSVIERLWLNYVKRAVTRACIYLYKSTRTLKACRFSLQSLLDSQTVSWFCATMEELQRALQDRGLTVTGLPEKGRCLYTTKDFYPGLSFYCIYFILFSLGNYFWIDYVQLSRLRRSDYKPRALCVRTKQLVFYLKVWWMFRFE